MIIGNSDTIILGFWYQVPDIFYRYSMLLRTNTMNAYGATSQRLVFSQSSRQQGNQKNLPQTCSAQVAREIVFWLVRKLMAGLATPRLHDQSGSWNRVITWHQDSWLVRKLLPWFSVALKARRRFLPAFRMFWKIPPSDQWCQYWREVSEHLGKYK